MRLVPIRPVVRLRVLLFAVPFAAGCGGGEPNPLPTVCEDVQATSLTVGQEAVIDPAITGGCLRLPAAPAGGAEYLVVAVATAGQETPAGTSGSYRLESQTDAVTPASAARAATNLSAFQRRPTAAEFHDLLRARERTLSRDPSRLFANRAPRPMFRAAPPVVGEQRTFKVCSTTQCTAFVDVTATARTVGTKVAIYVDNDVPAGGYTQTDLDAVGTLFDDHLYPIDTTHFGRESDLDENGVVIALLTDAVNALTPNCNTSGSVILGYFFGLDLLPQLPNSNAGEVFYSLVPDPGNASCSIDKDFADAFLAPTFIHEFQHMISFNQHVLIRGGESEDTWLNEGFSHFAEELGGRLIPDEPGSPAGSRFSQFAFGDVSNAHTYLRPDGLEGNFLITPGSSTGTLAERGANWLFVRWIADHFGADEHGTALTRMMVETGSRGSVNVENATGGSFPALVTEWQLANYVENLPGFTATNARLQYQTWNFRNTYTSLHNQRPLSFPCANPALNPCPAEYTYPLVPDSTVTGAYTRSGTLRAGSGRHLRVIQAPSTMSVAIELTDQAGAAIGANLAARIGVVRIR